MREIYVQKPVRNAANSYAKNTSEGLKLIFVQNKKKKEKKVCGLTEYTGWWLLFSRKVKLGLIASEFLLLSFRKFRTCPIISC